MAECPLRGEEVTDHPDRLWAWDKFVYLDEKQRAWLPLTIEVQPALERMARQQGQPPGVWDALGRIEDRLRVLLRQEDILLGNPMTPSQIGPSLLPILWQLYPDGRYRSSDSSFWRLVYHIKIDGVEDMLLELLPDD
ncbi:T-cell leukemia/lymphoma protein 1A isoform X2 [Piliocolobus tephrosceles]|nr:T-cell leukemia/lymphoma protein 1A isoform X2 [Piliocolobus tephrosceles]XP_030786344.1 T-cell leukemia/lymphoma protein 1A isoform X1 [Rhinopithecus roxellana]XP_030786345.1 T-cell leukemia/lymphoma protein 1A isoform X1 [Rhinopithecus roxellana]